jgi:hypothetical protein
MSKTSPNDLITITRADLVALADSLAGDANCALSKPAILNKVAATLLGPKHDWARIKKADAPIASQRAASRAGQQGVEAQPRKLETILHDGMTGEEITATAEIMPDGTIDVQLSEGMRVWIERNDGIQRVHVNDLLSEGPISVLAQPGHRMDVIDQNYELDMSEVNAGSPMVGSDRRRVIGFQVYDPETGENWGERPSFEIIPLPLARQELDDAFESGEDGFRLLAIREGDIEEPEFSED